MATYPLIQVDAFADKPFAGNPAAIMPLECPLDDALMQSIAMENNLSETAYFWPEANQIRLRWFTPAVEVDLCGHATLAAAHVWFEELGKGPEPVHFETRSGTLIVHQTADGYQMDLPAKPVIETYQHPKLTEALGATPLEAHRQGIFTVGDHILVEFKNADMLRALSPDMNLIKEINATIMATAPGDEEGLDFVSRFFGPTVGIDEDPVTGSAFCTLAPYWAERLGKNRLQAYQASARGGHVICGVVGDRVKLTGKAVTTIRGEFIL